MLKHSRTRLLRMKGNGRERRWFWRKLNWSKGGDQLIPENIMESQIDPLVRDGCAYLSLLGRRPC